MSAESPFDVSERAGLVDPAAPGANLRRRAAPPVAQAATSRLEQAVARFNASRSLRVVVGLTRTLGRPWVSVGAAAGSPSEIRITVAWELCWYQWGVDVDDERRGVFTIGKGGELDQLDGPARQWNAELGPDGKLVVGRPAKSRAPLGEPVG